MAALLALAGCGGGGATAPATNSNPGQTTLSITSISLPEGIAGKSYQTTLSASGGQAPYSWSVPSGFLPAGLQLDAATGAISGTAQNAGSGDVTIHVIDSGSPRQAASKTLRLNIAWPLEIQTASLPAAHLGAAYNAVVQASGSTVATSGWTITAGQLPPGLQLTRPAASQVEIAGAPTQKGSFPFTLQAQGSGTPAQSATRAFTLVVDDGVYIATENLDDAVEGLAYSAQLAAVNGKPPYRWSAVGLPAGLSIDTASGKISGVPGLSGGYNVNVTVSDSASPAQTASRALNLAVRLRMYINPPQGGVVRAYFNTSFSWSVTWFAGWAPYSLSIVSGTLPPGLTLQQSGLIAGIPTQLGTYTFTVQLRDSGSPPQTAQQSITIEVSAPPLALVGSLPTNAPINTLYDGYAAATGGTPPYSWALASGTLPPGLALSGATGEVHGTPATAGTYDFQLKVTDTASPPQTATMSYRISVAIALGRNDSPARATPLGNGGFSASISPFGAAGSAPDSDYYKLTASAGSVVKVEISAQAGNSLNPLDSVLEFVDANGIRLSACRLPGTALNRFTDSCLNDDLDAGHTDSELELLTPGTPGTQTTFYAHVLDWRGDARPDMVYGIAVTGAVDPLRITTDGLLAGTVSTAYGTTLAAIGGTGPLTWTLAPGSGPLPAGLTLSAQGALSGTATLAGTNTFTVIVRDSGNPAQTATATYTIVIGAPLVLVTESLPGATSGAAYNFGMIATGGAAPLQWGMVSDNFPCCLRFQDGTFSGTPQYPGTYLLRIGVVDSASPPQSAGKTYTLVVAAGPLSVDTSDVPTSAKLGASYSGQVSMIGGTPYVQGGAAVAQFSIASGTLPPGLSLSAYGTISGTPTAAGNFTFIVKVTGVSQPPKTATATLTIQVSP